MFLKNNIFWVIFFIISCQPLEIISPVEFDNSLLEKITISAKDTEVNIKYNSIFSEENIEGQLKTTPIEIINSWIKENVNNIGNENKLIINILEASIFKKEINNLNAKKYEEKTIFLYEVFILVDYELYDDGNFLLANTTVETSRSTTSKKYISINETEIIINELLHKALKDFTTESKSMISLYMKEYL